MKKEQIVSRNPKVMNGALVFAGTRVPVESLTDLLPSLKTWGSLTDLWVRPEGRPCRISASTRFATGNGCGLTISPQTFYVSACPATTV